jgi:hypothetical protein
LAKEAWSPDSLLKGFTDPATIFWAAVWAYFFHKIAGKKGAFDRRMGAFAISFLLATALSVLVPAFLPFALLRGKIGEYGVIMLFPLCTLPYFSPVRMALERTRWGKDHIETLRKAGEIQRQTWKKRWEVRMPKWRRAMTAPTS